MMLQTLYFLSLHHFDYLFQLKFWEAAFIHNIQQDNHSLKIFDLEADQCNNP